MRKFFTVISSSIISILIAEFLLRFFMPVRLCNTVSQFRYDAKLGVVSKPNLKKTILTDHIIEIFTNDIGTRNYLDKNELMQYGKIIFCIGDSYTEGTGNMTDQSYPFYLDFLLNRKNNIYEKKFSVINLGLGAYGSIQSYLILKMYIEKIGRMPDVVIYFICQNDIYDDALFKANRRHIQIVSGSPRYPYFIESLNEFLEYSQIYIRTKMILKKMLSLSPADYGAIEEKDSRGKIKQFDPERLPGLISLIDFSKANNIRLITSYADYTSNNYNLFKTFAAKNRVLFADYKPDLERMNRIFTRLPVNNEHSGGHFRSWVNFVIASNFAELISSSDNQK